MIQHMNCRRVKEREIHFDSHLSGFVYKVRVHGRVLIKKEIPGPDNVDEFLYEINALEQLYPAENVIQFYGVVVDDREEHVTGLLISYAARGALLDVIYDNDHSIPWPAREKWARQIVAGLSEIHEAGFVQGDFTLSNIVIDENDDAKIIDINRRGCPIGWEPPEATRLIESNQRISMYIGVKSDLYQLGMVLWALATQEDDPEAYGRPLKLEADVQVPRWYRRIVETCLSSNPRNRAQAFQLLSWFPEHEEDSRYGRPNDSSASLDYTNGEHTTNGVPVIKTVHPPSDWQYVGWGNPRVSSVVPEEPYYPTRGRSPPSTLGDYDPSGSGHRMYTWSETYNRPPAVPSVSDIPASGMGRDSDVRFRESRGSLGQYSVGESLPRGVGRERERDETLTGPTFDGRTQEEEVIGTSPKPFHPREPIHGLASNNNDHHHDDHDRDDNDNDNDDDSNPRTGRRPYRTHAPGKTGPNSQADSGKDLTDLASTPREHSRQDKSGKSIFTTTTDDSGRSPHRDGDCYQATATATGAVTATATGTATGTTGTSRRQQKGSARSRSPSPQLLPSAPSPTIPPVRRHLSQPDDLKGVGSALDSGVQEKLERRGEISLEDEDEDDEEFGVGCGKSDGGGEWMSLKD